MRARSGWRSMALVLALVGAACAGSDPEQDGATAHGDVESTSSPSTVEAAGSGDILPLGDEPAPPGHITVVEVAAVNDVVRPVSVYRPAGEGPWPIAVLFAGWDSPRSALDQFARELAAEGLVVATTDIDTDRLLEGDYECAQRLATLSALEYGGDPEGPLITGGHSYGASVASMASLFDPFFAPATGQLLECGLEGEHDLGPTDLVVGLSGAWYPGECAADPAMAAFASTGFPAHVLPFDGNPGVPFIVAHGTDDPICPFAQAQTAAAEWEAGGHPTEFLVLEGAGHCEGVIFGASPDDWPDVEFDPDSLTSREVVDAIVTWVESYRNDAVGDPVDEPATRSRKRCR